MSKKEIERVKEDIDIIKEAAGLELPFGWEDVWIHLYLIPVGIWLAIWSFLPFQLSRIWRILPVVILAPIFVLLRIKYKRTTGRSPMRRRSYSVVLFLTPISGLCAFGYFVWIIRSGHDFFFAVGGMWFFMGLMLLIFAFAQPGQFFNLGWAIPMILCGITITIWPVLNVMDTNVGIVLIVGGSATALVQAYQLKRSTSKNGAD
ncbi:MAG: hypothetical protein HQ580_03350 [Planctomycetes bacterium]|nr:hypothetical protein [Planctomycetota bacterium]